MKLFMIYLLLINILAFALMGADKRRAKKGKWRIPEKQLFLAAALGGSIGSVAGMHCFRHKTRHTSFAVGMPVILVIHLILFFFLFLR